MLIILDFPSCNTRDTHLEFFFSRSVFFLPEPHTTNTKSANSQGPTGYFSSADFYKIQIINTLQGCKCAKCPARSELSTGHQQEGVYMSGIFHDHCDRGRKLDLIIPYYIESYRCTG